MSNDDFQKQVQRYEEMYHRPDDVRQAEQKMIGEALQAVMRKREVLEIGCSTGHWTQFISPSSKDIVAVDSDEVVVELARQKSYFCPVVFEALDLYALPYDAARFDGGVVSFWFNSIPQERVREFLDEFHRVLKPGSHVFIADQVSGEGHDPLHFIDIFMPYAESFGPGNVFFAKHYWYVAYTVKGGE